MHMYARTWMHMHVSFHSNLIYHTHLSPFLPLPPPPPSLPPSLPPSPGNPTALLLEYPLYGSLYAFLVCKRLGRISNNAKGWAGTDNQNLEDTILRALPDENRQFLSSLLDDYKVRSRPFLAPLNEEFSDIDLLLFALQIANGMQFLAESGVST